MSSTYAMDGRRADEIGRDLDLATERAREAMHVERPDEWSSDRVRSLFAVLVERADVAQDLVEAAEHARREIGRASSNYEALYARFLEGSIDSEPEQPDHVRLNGELRDAVSRASAAASLATKASAAYKAAQASADERQHRYEAAAAVMGDARAEARRAWEQFSAAWSRFSAAKNTAVTYLRAEGLHEVEDVRADAVSLHTSQRMRDFADALGLVGEIAESENPAVTGEWAEAGLDELRRPLPDWARRILANGNHSDQWWLRAVEAYERAHGVVKSAYIVPADMTPAEAEGIAQERKPFGAEA